MIFETERLILRPWENEDAFELYRHAKNQNVALICGWKPHVDVDNSLFVIKNFLSNDNTFAIVLKETKKPIGSIGLFNPNDELVGENEIEIGYWIGEEYWGNGFVPEAVNELLKYCFEELGYQKVWAGYFEGNLKSKRVVEKCGFEYFCTDNNFECKQLGEIKKLHRYIINKSSWLINKY